MYRNAQQRAHQQAHADLLRRLALEQLPDADASVRAAPHEPRLGVHRPAGDVDKVAGRLDRGHHVGPAAAHLWPQSHMDCCCGRATGKAALHLLVCFRGFWEHGIHEESMAFMERHMLILTSNALGPLWRCCVCT